MEVDDESLLSATQALQAVERLSLRTRRLEDSGKDLQSVNEKPLLELKQLLLMHVPSSITSEARQRFSCLIDQALEGQCKKILAGVVLTCPWFEATQKERGEQAKHNILLVVVMSHDQQFFTPANPQIREAGGVIDMGWLSIVELYHFGRFLVKGRTRYVEALFCPEAALVYASDEWRQLQSQIDASQVTGLRGFLEACCGQAMGSVAKKRKHGGMKLRENSTLAEICEAFRLLHHAHNHHHSLPPATATIHPPTLPDVACQALSKLQALYQDPDVSKQDIFTCLSTWHDELRGEMKQCKFSDLKAVTVTVGSWMMETRLQGRKLQPAEDHCLVDDYSKLTQLMSEIGGPVTKLTPQQILLVARAGSFMYGLSTPESDVDYVVVYRDTTETVLSACSRPSECMESRGPSKKVEYGAYEARLLSEMLLKGSVVILELVYLDNHDFVSPLWKIFHKINSVRHMMTGSAPPVRVEGPVRDFIMRVRTEELTGELSRENLMRTATEQYETLRNDLASRQRRLPENPDFSFVTDWLLQVRGIAD
ncbi:hypothetical protein BaRGS_00036913 [Batillaria attramentaria]|uniref:Polymerase nucleotidyl transferase domain-containing protein n=1 Tax=Batillaria attramentaria TaxID=370345 RepID=A0ABD0JAJ2_9CAEN